MGFFLPLLAAAGIGSATSAGFGAIERWMNPNSDVMDGSAFLGDVAIGAPMGMVAPGVGGGLIKLGTMGGQRRIGQEAARKWGARLLSPSIKNAGGSGGSLAIRDGYKLGGLGRLGAAGGGFSGGIRGYGDREPAAGLNPFIAPTDFIGRAAPAQNPIETSLAEQLGLTDRDLFGGGGGALSDIPVFTRSYDDYLQSPILRDLANKEIINQNAAIVRANQDLRRNMGQEVDAATRSGENVRQQIGVIRDTRAGEHRAATQNLSKEQQDNRLDVQKMINRMNAGITDDTARDKVIASRAKDLSDAERYEEADRALVGDIGQAGADNLAMLEAAEGQQTRAETRGIRNNYMNQILDNRAQAKDNWKARPQLINAFADAAMGRDMQGYGSFLSGWQSLLNANASARNTDQSVRLQRAQLLAEGAKGPDIRDQIALMNYWNQPYGPEFKGEGPGNTEMNVRGTLGDHYYNATKQRPYTGYVEPNTNWFADSSFG